MSRNRWLTPDSAPTEYTCRRVFIPNDPQWIAIVAGALNELIYDYNFEPYGTATPAETAAIYSQMFDTFSLEGGQCRVIGEIMMWGGFNHGYPGWRPFDPPGTSTVLICDGAIYNIADYPALFAELGNAYGGVEADGTFAVPDFTGRFARNSDFIELEIGDTGGEAEVTLNTAQIPSHNHTDAGHVHTIGNSGTALAVAPGELPVLVPNPIPTTTGSGNADITDTGGGEAHDNLPPYLVITYYIQAK